ncbi:MAG: hypothetical protein J5949_08290, partial [Oscillospiraceae bacterium]|nr:hypothetical protein [Oscillospiraceae bacterium]
IFTPLTISAYAGEVESPADDPSFKTYSDLQGDPLTPMDESLLLQQEDTLPDLGENPSEDNPLDETQEDSKPEAQTPSDEILLISQDDLGLSKDETGFPEDDLLLAKQSILTSKEMEKSADENLTLPNEDLPSSDQNPELTKEDPALTDENPETPLTEGKNTRQLLSANPPLDTSPIPADASRQILHIHADGLPETAEQVLVQVLDSGSALVQELSLTRSSGFVIDWAAPDPEAQYSLRLKDLLDPAGNSLLSAWECTLTENPNPVSSTKTFTDWVERPELPNGTYMFRFGDSDAGRFLAAGTYTKRPVERYSLAELQLDYNLQEAEPPEAARWQITNIVPAPAICMQNVAYPSYSLTRQMVRDYQYALFEGEGQVFYSNGLLYSVMSEQYDYLVLDGNLNRTDSAASATVFTPLRWETVTLTSTVRDIALAFASIISEETVSLEVSLTVNGNIADRSLSFPFVVEVDGEAFASFTLRHGESRSVQGIRPGASVTVYENPSEYTVISTAGETEGGAIISFPAAGSPVKVSFLNTLQGTISTGLSAPGSSGPARAVLLSLAALAGLHFGVQITMRNQKNSKKEEEYFV